MSFVLMLTTLPALAVCLQGTAKFPLKPNDSSTPVQQRISIQGKNTISVSWSTYEHIKKPCVRYGISRDDLSFKACSSDSHSYRTSRTWFNMVSLRGLKPATTHYYKVDAINATTETFLSPRAPGDITPFALNAVIDLGVYGDDGFISPTPEFKRDKIPNVSPSLNHTTIHRLAQTADNYEFILHPGDIAYADQWQHKAKNDEEGVSAYQAILEQFYDQYGPVTRRKPYMVGPGNHEAACQVFPHMTDTCVESQRNFSDFRIRFESSMPSAFPSSSKNVTAKKRAHEAIHLAKPPFWYSFDYGMVHVVMINTETDFEGAPSGKGGSDGLESGPFGWPGQQLKFVEMDLASVDRSLTPWVVVAGHRPWYSVSGFSSACETCQAAFETLMYKYGVDLGIFGHVHNSQRYMPIYKGSPDLRGMNNPKAPMYIVAGAAGNIEGVQKIGRKRPAGIAYANDRDFAYATIRFENKHNMTVSFVKSTTGDILDSATLYKDHKEKFPVRLVAD